MVLLAGSLHLTRGEMQNIFLNLLTAALVGFVAYARWRLKPLEDRGASPVRVAN